MSETKAKTEAKVDPKANPKDDAVIAEGVASLGQRIGDPVEVAIAEGVVERSLCGRDSDRVVDLDDYAVKLARAVKKAVAEYRGE